MDPEDIGILPKFVNNYKNWYIGTIGFSYKDWVSPFYPFGTLPRGYLSYYNKFFNSVEIDTSFHAIPRVSSITSWANSTTQDFRFCFKIPRVITHELGLVGAENILIEFLDALQPLNSKLGPILIQFPPSFTQVYYEELKRFVEALPKTYRFAIEFRHASWYNSKTSGLLADYRIGWVAIDYPKLPQQIILTTDFIYIRWIGINNFYHIHTHERVDKSNQLRWWLDVIQPAAESVDELYGYFNNDYAGFAAGTCQRFKQLAGISNLENDAPYQETFL